MLILSLIYYQILVEWSNYLNFNFSHFQFTNLDYFPSMIKITLICNISSEPCSLLRNRLLLDSVSIFRKRFWKWWSNLSNFFNEIFYQDVQNISHVFTKMTEDLMNFRGHHNYYVFLLLEFRFEDSKIANLQVLLETFSIVPSSRTISLRSSKEWFKWWWNGIVPTSATSGFTEVHLCSKIPTPVTQLNNKMAGVLGGLCETIDYY